MKTEYCQWAQWPCLAIALALESDHAFDILGRLERAISIVERAATHHGLMLQRAPGKTEAIVCKRGEGKQDVTHGLIASGRGDGAERVATLATPHWPSPWRRANIPTPWQHGNNLLTPGA